MHLAPADYERKQTLVNAERFTTPELKELEGKILEAEEKILTLEREIFETLRALACRTLRGSRRQLRPSRSWMSRSRWRRSRRRIAIRGRGFRNRARCEWWRAASGDREVDGARRPAVHPQRHLLSSGDGVHSGHYRAEHGRQVDLLAADGAAGDLGAGGFVCPGGERRCCPSSTGCLLESEPRTIWRAGGRLSWSR